MQDAVHRQVKRDAGKNGTGKLKSGREKKLERKDNNLKRDATREVAVLRFKQGCVVSRAFLFQRCAADCHLRLSLRHSSRRPPLEEQLRT